MKFKILLVSVMLFFVCGAVFAEKSVWYINDNTHTSKQFNEKYVDILQSLMDKGFGINNVNVSNYSKSDMNTSQCLELFDRVYKYSKNHQDVVVLMIGDSNYHNLYGFLKFIKNREPKDANETVKIKEHKNIYEINSEMLKLYAGTKDNTLTKIIGVVYDSLMETGKKQTFKPKVVPHFYALNSSFVIDNNLMATLETYRYAWELIKTQKYDEAKTFLNSILEKKPSQSMLYYALGSAYLSEKSEGCEFKALQCFEDGILVDPLNKDNICYKGLVLLYMMYKGEITAEVLYFVRGLNEYITNPNEELESIMAINTVDYDKKIQMINDWILSDMEKLKNKSIIFDTQLVFTSYPEDIPVNALISEYAKSTSKVMYVDNKEDIGNKSDSVIFRIAKRMYDFLKENKIMN